jgi:hypothetical protein
VVEVVLTFAFFKMEIPVLAQVFGRFHLPEAKVDRLSAVVPMKNRELPLQSLTQTCKNESSHKSFLRPLI